MKKYAMVDTAKSTRILHQRVDLVLLAHGAELEEGEPGVHREHHDRAQQDEQRVAARFHGFHGYPLAFPPDPAQTMSVGAQRPSGRTNSTT